MKRNISTNDIKFKAIKLIRKELDQNKIIKNNLANIYTDKSLKTKQKKEEIEKELEDTIKIYRYILNKLKE